MKKLIKALLTERKSCIPKLLLLTQESKTDREMTEEVGVGGEVEIVKQEWFCSHHFKRMILNTQSQDVRECVCPGKDVDTSCSSAKVDCNSKENVRTETSVQDNNLAKSSESVLKIIPINFHCCYLDQSQYTCRHILETVCILRVITCNLADWSFGYRGVWWHIIVCSQHLGFPYGKGQK